MDKTIQKKENIFLLKIKNLLVKTALIKESEDLQQSEKQILLSDIENALSDLRIARNSFELAKDPEMIEACIFEIKSAEARYSFLLRKAKRLATANSESR